MERLRCGPRVVPRSVTSCATAPARHLLSLGGPALHLVSIARHRPAGLSMSHFSVRFPLPARCHSRELAALAATSLFCLAAQPTLAADEADAPKGQTVSVLKAAKSCFDNIVEVTGIILPREETSVRPERPGLKVADVLVDAGETVTAGQTLARLTPPEGGNINVQAPVAGVVTASTATIGAFASGRGEAL